MFSSIHDPINNNDPYAQPTPSPNWKFYLLALPLYVLIDLPWLLINNNSVQNMIENIQRQPLKFRVWAAIPVYLALAFLVSRAHTRLEAFGLGMACYTVYDWTNLSTFVDYSWKFAIFDSIWGGVLTCLVFTILTRPFMQRLWGGGGAVGF